MEREHVFFYAIVGFVIYICIKMYEESELFNLKCVISDLDNNKYCVRERDNIDDATELLATIAKRCSILVQYLKDNHPNNPITKRLIEGFNPKKIYETLPTSEFTAYSENKGEKLAFCLQKNKASNQFIDPNTLTFVALHELAHIGTKSIGHTPEFWRTFQFLLQKAEECEIYEPVDYSKKPISYCSMIIDDNPYYDE